MFKLLENIEFVHTKPSPCHSMNVEFIVSVIVDKLNFARV